jgi:hypothetical protein
VILKTNTWEMFQQYHVKNKIFCVEIIVMSSVLDQQAKWDVLCDRPLKHWSKRVSECCLSQNEYFFSYIMARTSYKCKSNEMIIPTLNYISTLNWYFIAHFKNSPCLDMSLHSYTLFLFRPNKSLFLHLDTACLAAK